jgi:uncharacterized membrane protein
MPVPHPSFLPSAGEGAVLGKLVAYATILVVFVVVDFIWLGFVAKGFYRAELGDLLLPRPNMVTAVLFYLLFAGGLFLFVVQPAAAAGSLLRAALLGMAFGLVAYGTYDLTNLATLRGFSARLAAVDMAWGAVLTGVAAVAGYLALAKLDGS